MLSHYFVAAQRHLMRRPAYFAINLLGLAVGLAACLLIALYVHDELSYDRFHPNAERTYRVLREFDTPSLRAALDTTPMALAPALEGIPGIEKAVRVLEGAPRVRRDGREFIERAFMLADDAFFDVFSFPILLGEARLDWPDTLLITESTAARYFPPGLDPVGSLLEVEGAVMEIIGVLADAPKSSHLRFDFLASTLYVDERQDERAWSINDFATYVLLEPDADKDRVRAEIARVIDARNTAPSENGNNFVPHLQPLTDIHFGRSTPRELSAATAPVANPLYVYLFTALAVSILLIACANFTNLATARASERAREIGVRKTLGAARRQLAYQFLGESLLTSAVSLMLALGLCKLALPYFNAIAEKSLTLAPLYSGANALALLGMIVLVGVTAGLYPALVLSRFETIGVLKGGPVRAGLGGERFRKALVVFQFSVSIAAIAATAVVLDQFQYLRATGLGFDAENVLVVRQIDYLDDRIEVFKQEVARLPGIQGVTAAFSVPGTLFQNSLWQSDDPDAALQNVNYTFIDTEYVETLGLTIIAGRAPSSLLAEDATAVLLNEAGAERFGWSAEQAVGKRIVPPWGDDRHTVVGVTKDFNYYSLRNTVYPAVLAVKSDVPSYAGGTSRYVAIRVAPDEAANVTDAVRGVWAQLSDLPFQFSLLADDLVAQYGAEQRLVAVFAAFAGLAVLVGCLGLFGLAAFAVDRRRKEIGVRKVLGASKARVLGLLSAEYLLLVVAAFLIAAPIAHAAMQRWLEGFAYRIELGWQPFVLAAALAAASALIAIGAQVLRAASTHPARALRHE